MNRSGAWTLVNGKRHALENWIVDGMLNETMVCYRFHSDGECVSGLSPVKVLVRVWRRDAQEMSFDEAIALKAAFDRMLSI